MVQLYGAQTVGCPGQSRTIDLTTIPNILSSFLQVDWDLTLSMLVITARQIYLSSPRVNIDRKVSNQLFRNLDRMTICGKS